MKSFFKSFVIIVALLYGMNALAGGAVKVNGITVGTTATGLDNDGNAASASIADNKCTLTITPGPGKYITVNDISAIKTIDGSLAQTRTDPAINVPLELTAVDPTADPSGITSYTFDVTDVNYDYEVTANFQARTSIEDATITLGKASYTYTGDEIKPTITKVVLSDGKTELGSADYTVKYANNINVPQENGPAPTITLTGIGKYKDEASKTFTIEKAEITPVVNIEGWTYGDAAKVPSIKEGTNPGGGEESFKYKEKDASDNQYSKDVPTNAGNYIVRATVAQTPNYKGGTATAEFTISPKSIANVNITLTPKSIVFNGQNQKPEVSVKDGETDLVLDKDYTLTNEGGTNVGEYSVTVTGKGNYDSKTTASKKYNITVLETTPTVTLADTETPIVYDGTEKKPAVKVTVTIAEGANPTELTTDDYDVAYSDNVNAGENTAKATVTLKVNYKGSAETTFTIAPKSIADVTIEDIADQDYTGEAVEPTVTVKDGDKTLILDTDYTVSYSNNINPGLATAENAPTATITGKGNYDPNTSATKTFTIGKTSAVLKFSEESAEATIGQPFTPPTLTKIPEDLEGIKFTSSKEEVATVDEATGAVKLEAEGTTEIKASFKGNDRWEPAEASYTLTVSQDLGNGYALWVNGVQVTRSNETDVLGDKSYRKAPSFFYHSESNMLIISNNNKPVVIESRLPELTIFLNGISKLERIFYNNLGNQSRMGSLKVTAYCNIPGLVTLNTEHKYGVISGFSDLTIDHKSVVYLLSPEKGVYKGGRLLEQSGGRVAKTATIGQHIKPLVDDRIVRFDSKFFTSRKQTRANEEIDLSNTPIEDILFTLNQSNADPDYNDGFDSSDNSIAIVSTLTDENVANVASKVFKNNYIPGSTEFAENMAGAVTFMVPDGEGDIEIELENIDKHEFHLKTGTNKPTDVSTLFLSKVTIPYQVKNPEYNYLYMTASSADTRIGKRDKAHGKIYSIKITPKVTNSENPLSEIDDFPQDVVPEVVIGTTDPDPTGIISVHAGERAGNNDTWYSIDGQQITQPTKKGIYIQNGKKIVIK